MAEVEFPKDEADFKKLESSLQKFSKIWPRIRGYHTMFDCRENRARNAKSDVLVEDRIGQYQIRIVIDCKDYKRRLI